MDQNINIDPTTREVLQDIIREPSKYSQHLKHAGGRGVEVIRKQIGNLGAVIFGLSGGFYRPFDIVNGFGMMRDNSILPPTSENFVPGRESMFTTSVFVDEELVGARPDYVPTGAYTLEQASHKYSLTERVFNATKTCLDLDKNVSVLTPNPVMLYETSTELNDPVYGLITARDTSMREVHEYVDRSDPLANSELFYSLGAAIARTHMVTGMFHGQLTLGNIYRHREGDLFMPKDWHTARPFENMKQSDIYANAALDTMVPLASLWHRWSSSIDERFAATHRHILSGYLSEHMAKLIYVDRIAEGVAKFMIDHRIDEITDYAQNIATTFETLEKAGHMHLPHSVN